MVNDAANQIAKIVIPKRQRALRSIALVLWTGIGFFIGQLIIIGLLILLQLLDIDFMAYDEAVVSSVIAAISYVLAFAVVVGGVWLFTKEKPSLETFGLQRLPRLSELGLAVVGFLIYIVASGLVVQAVVELVPSFDLLQEQDVGFTMLASRYQYILAFVTLVVVAPLAEEALFRGFLYGKLRRYAPWWLAAVVVSLLFGAAHLQWNVAIDTFVLSLFLCGLREIAGSIWAGVLVHMVKNGLAFYFLFVNPFLLQSIGG